VYGALFLPRGAAVMAVAYLLAEHALPVAAYTRLS